MTKFIRSPTQPYTLITPGSPLEELEQFLKENEFALGMCCIDIFHEMSNLNFIIFLQCQILVGNSY